MMHLLRSVFAGFFVAVSLGTFAVVNGFDPVTVVVGVWIFGSVLSLVIAASVTPFEVREAEALVVQGVDPRAVEGPMRPDLSARELALWDTDLNAERFEADLAEDRAGASDVETGSKTA